MEGFEKFSVCRGRIGLVNAEIVWEVEIEEESRLGGCVGKEPCGLVTGCWDFDRISGVMHSLVADMKVED